MVSNGRSVLSLWWKVSACFLICACSHIFVCIMPVLPFGGVLLLSFCVASILGWILPVICNFLWWNLPLFCKGAIVGGWILCFWCGLRECVVELFLCVSFVVESAWFLDWISFSEHHHFSFCCVVFCVANMWLGIGIQFIILSCT